MTIEIVVVFLSAILGVLGYIAKALHNMDKNLAVVIAKGVSHDATLADHETRIRDLEVNL